MYFFWRDCIRETFQCLLLNGMVYNHFSLELRMSVKKSFLIVEGFCFTKARIMHQPLPVTYEEGVRGGDGEIIHPLQLADVPP